MIKNIFIEQEEEIGPSSDEPTPEQRLWRYVILFYLQDIQQDYNLYTSSLNGKRGMLYEKLCSHLVMANCDWIHSVCEFAGLSHDQFFTIAKLIVMGKKEIKSHSR